jgi:hypothetical protein
MVPVEVAGSGSAQEVEMNGLPLQHTTWARNRLR